MLLVLYIKILEIEMSPMIIKVPKAFLKHYN
jgi:hypothetical protein